MDLRLSGGMSRRSIVATGALALTACAASHVSGPREEWRILPTEPFGRKQDDIFFVSRRVGWYGNGAGKLYKTSDAGETWRQVWEHPGTHIRALGFTDALDGFLGNVGVGYAPGVTDATPLYRTRDGGETWTPVDIEGAGPVEGICAIDIARLSSRPYPLIHAAGRVFGPALVLRSLDGGRTWTKTDLSAQTGMILDIKFLNAETGFVCAATTPDVEHANAEILRTVNGGATWQSVYRSNRPRELCWKMSFPSASVGYATVQNNSDEMARQIVLKTTDGGSTWVELPLAEHIGLREFGIGFVTEHRGWVGTSTTGFETLDGGRTWRAVDLGRSANKLRVVREGRSFSAFAIGQNVARLDGILV